VICAKWKSKLVGAVGQSTTAVNLEARKKLIEVVKMARGAMSQRAFGKLLGVSATAVQLWEKGETVPDTENLAKIAARAGYTMEELLNYLDAKPLPEPSDVNQILKHIKSMPLNEVAIIAHAAVERIVAAAEASGDEAKVG
jgi:transcriptional regulator with XRE-family HTH domain